MSRCLAYAVLVAALVMEARPAEACSPPNVVVPANGSTNVPINIVEVVTANPFVEPGPYVRKTGTEVPVSSHTVKEWGLRRIQFLEPLEPNTTYEVVLTDIIFTTFVTGEANDVVAPAPITVDDVAISYAMLETETSCGSVDVEVIGPMIEDEPLLRVRVTGAGLVQERMVPGYGFPLLGWETARTALDVVPNEIYDVEIWARDYAGNEGPITRIEDVKVRDCGTIAYVYGQSLRDCPRDERPDVIPLPEEDASAGCTTTGGSYGGVLVAVGAVVLRRRRRAR